MKLSVLRGGQHSLGAVWCIRLQPPGQSQQTEPQTRSPQNWARSGHPEESRRAHISGVQSLVLDVACCWGQDECPDDRMTEQNPRPMGHLHMWSMCQSAGQGLHSHMQNSEADVLPRGSKILNPTTKTTKL